MTDLEVLDQARQAARADFSGRGGPDWLDVIFQAIRIAREDGRQQERQRVVATVEALREPPHYLGTNRHVIDHVVSAIAE